MADQQVIDELVFAANRMVLTVDQAKLALGQGVMDILGPQVEHLRAVLGHFPLPSDFTILRDEHLEVKFYRAEGQAANEEARGVEIRHRFANITVRVYNNPTRAENLASARAYLEKRLKEHGIAAL